MVSARALSMRRVIASPSSLSITVKKPPSRSSPIGTAYTLGNDEKFSKRSPTSRSSPFRVPIQIFPTRSSNTFRIESAESPSAVVKVRNSPFFSRVTPPPRVPNQTEPSRAATMLVTGPFAIPSLFEYWINLPWWKRKAPPLHVPIHRSRFKSSASAKTQVSSRPCLSL